MSEENTKGDLHCCNNDNIIQRERNVVLQQEHQLQRPQKMHAEVHRIHPHIKRIIIAGKLREDLEVVKPVSQTLYSTSAAWGGGGVFWLIQLFFLGFLKQKVFWNIYKH